MFVVGFNAEHHQAIFLDLADDVVKVVAAHEVGVSRTGQKQRDRAMPHIHDAIGGAPGITVAVSEFLIAARRSSRVSAEAPAVKAAKRRTPISANRGMAASQTKI